MKNEEVKVSPKQAFKKKVSIGFFSFIVSITFCGRRSLYFIVKFR